MSRSITPRTSLENLKRDARRWLTALRAGDPEARARLLRALPGFSGTPTLRDVQHAIAREYDLPGWTALKAQLLADAPLRRYERVADALATAYRTGDDGAMQIVWDYFGHMRAWDAMKRYVRLALGRPEEPGPSVPDDISIDDARFLVARAQEFESWDDLAEYARQIPAGRSMFARAVGLYSLDGAGVPQSALTSRDWEEVVTVLRERRLGGLRANGEMTDEALARISRLEHITSLDLDGSRQLTDAGLRHLARLPGLRHLDLAGCTGITDRGLDVVKRLPALESIRLAWSRVTDAGVAALGACDAIRVVDLSGTATGDGAIRALAGKRHLHELQSGNAVSDDGLALLHELPVFKQWQGGEVRLALLGFRAGPNFLLLRGTFTDAGLARLVGLDGLFALNIDGRELAITAKGLAPLADLPRLGLLAFDATDGAMPYIAALPHLRFLMCQDTTAGDDGFVALSRSRSIEYVWGRRCHNLRRRGFVALADMPALRALSVSCRNVDDEGLSALPRFPALTELMPMDVPDEGYRHIGRCERLESLVLMYCRETGDGATEHIAGLRGLRKYFASYNRITDRTPEILSGIPSLEELTFDTCTGLTNAGVATLARLPRLQAVNVSGMPKVTRDIAAVFPPGVRVSYSR